MRERSERARSVGGRPTALTVDAKRSWEVVETVSHLAIPRPVVSDTLIELALTTRICFVAWRALVSLFSHTQPRVVDRLTKPA